MIRCRAASPSSDVWIACIVGSSTPHPPPSVSHPSWWVTASNPCSARVAFRSASTPGKLSEPDGHFARSDVRESGFNRRRADADRKEQRSSTEERHDGRATSRAFGLRGVRPRPPAPRRSSATTRRSTTSSSRAGARPTPRCGPRPRRSSPGCCSARTGRGRSRRGPRSSARTRSRPDLGDFLEAAARLQLDDLEGARRGARRGSRTRPTRGSRARSPRRGSRARTSRTSTATSTSARAEVLATFEVDRFAPEVWDAFARLCADTDFDPTEVVAHVPDDRTFEVITALRSSAPEGVDRIVELIWARNPGDARVLALGAPVRVEARERARDGVVGAHARRRHGPHVPAARARRGRAGRRRSSGCVRARSRTRRSATGAARELLERAVPSLADDEVVDAVLEVWTIAAALADSVVVGAARPRRAGRSRSRRRCSSAARRARRTRCSCTGCRWRPPST